MANSALQTLLKERKYPFIFTLSAALLICFTLLLHNTTTTTNYTHTHFRSPKSLSSITNPFSPPDLNFNWKLCTASLSVDYIPCLDNFVAIKALKSRRHMEHRERHCPSSLSRCLLPLPIGYKVPIPWPKSRDMVRMFVFWFGTTMFLIQSFWNTRRTKIGCRNLAIISSFQVVALSLRKEFLTTLSLLKRVVLDVGCGVASFGGALLDKNAITMSFAPKDEHEAQIQFALERGIPATLSVIGTQKLTFPENAFDMIHCARCRVHWDADGGKPLLELNRILRPGGFFVWSATPVYRNGERDQNVWKAMVALTKSMCWKVAAKPTDSSGIGLIIYQKPVSSSCYSLRKENNPPVCDQINRMNNSWYSPLGSCLSQLPDTGMASWPASWPQRLTSKPPSLSTEPDVENLFYEDTKHWSALVSEVYLDGLTINWSSVRNVMDMSAGYGGFAAALIDLPLWVMNVIPIDIPDTLSIIFDRGLIGIYHDWCESLSTYPRTYDLLHSSFLLGYIMKRCDLIDVAMEMDRILRPGGTIIVHDTMEMIKKLTPIMHSLHWSVTLCQDQFLVGKKTFWRPKDVIIGT